MELYVFKLAYLTSLSPVVLVFSQDIPGEEDSYNIVLVS